MTMLKVAQNIMRTSTDVMVSIMELCAATSIIVLNALLKQREKLLAHESGHLLKRDQKKVYEKNKNASSSEECMYDPRYTTGV